MSENLDLLRKDVELYLNDNGFVTFYGEPRISDGDNAIYWETAKHPNFRDFLNAAKSLGVKLVVLVQKEFTETELQAVAEELEAAVISREERREYESQIDDMRLYVGLTSSIEINFSHSGSTYVFWIETDWYADFNRIAEEIEFSDGTFPQDESMGGFFSNN